MRDGAQIAPRDYVSPSGPYTYLIGCSGDTLFEWNVDHLADAIQLLSDGYAPAVVGGWAFVCDPQFILLGWSVPHPSVSIPHWVGTEEAFGLLYQMRELAEVVWFDIQSEAKLGDVELPVRWQLPFDRST